MIVKLIMYVSYDDVNIQITECSRLLKITEINIKQLFIIN